MSKFIRKILASILYPLQTWIEMKRLRRNSSSSIIAGVFDDVAAKRLQPEEKTWIDKIEAIRENLNISGDKLKVHPRERTLKTIGDFSKVASIPSNWGLFLFKLLRRFQPSVCLEIGSGLGVSTMYQTAALELNRHGKLVGLEAHENSVAQASLNLKKLELERAKMITGWVEDTLTPTLEKLKTVDFMFVDAAKDKQFVISTYETVFPCLSEEAIIVFDDLMYFEGVRQAWKVITARSEVKVSIDLGRMGLVKTGLEDEKQNKIYRIYTAV